MIRFAFGNNYSGCSIESRVRMGAGEQWEDFAITQVREMLMISDRVEFIDLFIQQIVVEQLCVQPSVGLRGRTANEIDTNLSISHGDYLMREGLNGINVCGKYRVEKKKIQEAHTCQNDYHQ